MKESNEFAKLGIIGFCAIFLISLLAGNLMASIKLSVIYCAFLYLPFLSLVAKLNTGETEKFLLANLAGLSYGFVYILLDVVLKIPLSDLTFVASAACMYFVSYLLSKNYENLK